ncbi:MAG: hypothetical protein HOC74_14490 [Gemmatimonadetes bacterium]|nr:hypothetical protein [Gemmatimonadota bacterium]
MELTIEIPDSMLPGDLDKGYLREAFFSMLYHLGRVSEKEACAALGKTRREFEELLPSFGFSVLRDDRETIEIELNA